jgi:hypothetical protein
MDHVAVKLLRPGERHKFELNIASIFFLLFSINVADRKKIALPVVL